MRISRKNLISNVAIIIIMLYSIMPFVGRFISTYLTTYFYLLILAFVFVYILIGKGKVSLKENAQILFPFVIWRCLMLFHATDFILWSYESLIELIPLILGLFILTYREEANKTFVFIIAGAFLVTVLTTIRGLVIYPDASRWLASASSAQESKLMIYDNMNIGGYNFIYSLVLIYPMLILAFKKKKIGIIPTVLSVIGILVLLLSAGYTIALLFFLVSSLLFLFHKKVGVKEVILFIVILIAILIFANTYLIDALNWLAMNIENEEIAYRLQLLAGGRNVLLNAEDDRLKLYLQSLETFLNDPFFGTLFAPNEKIGGHSFVLDILGSYGLIGLFCLVFMYYKIYSVYYKPYQHSLGYGFLLWSFIQAIALSFVNTGMWLPVLAIYIPCIAKLIFEKDGMEIGSTNVVES